jgi:NAD(P)-dependent dehydrogenase (short-subunit alcohol dehydrogenase family)
LQIDLSSFAGRLDNTGRDVKVIGIECDVASELSVQRALKEVNETFGKIDAVVASAGASSRPFLLSVTHLERLSFASLLPRPTGIVENFSALE